MERPISEEELQELEDLPIEQRIERLEELERRLRTSLDDDGA